MKAYEAIKKLAPRAHPEILKVFRDRSDILANHNITTKLRLAHFLSQMHHESWGFRALREIRSDSSSERKYGKHTRVGRILGNTQPGDGAKFKGRGIIQLTGRDNYRRYGKKVGLDLVSNPVLAEDPKVALMVACAYWTSKGLNKYADLDDIRTITKRINGGFNGFADRKRLLRLYKKAVQ